MEDKKNDKVMVFESIKKMIKRGYDDEKIAEELNTDGYRTLTGLLWNEIRVKAYRIKHFPETGKREMMPVHKRVDGLEYIELENAYNSLDRNRLHWVIKSFWKIHEVSVRYESPLPRVSSLLKEDLETMVRCVQTAEASGMMLTKVIRNYIKLDEIEFNGELVRVASFYIQGVSDIPVHPVRRIIKDKQEQESQERSDISVSTFDQSKQINLFDNLKPEQFNSMANVKALERIASGIEISNKLKAETNQLLSVIIADLITDEAKTILKTRIGLSEEVLDV
jgi:hypothetical protein